MAGKAQFTIGTQVRCTDGRCGVVGGMIIDPATRSVTHLVIGPGHQEATGRLVPMDLVDATNGEVTLRCTLDEFSHLDPAEQTGLVEGGPDAVGPGGMPAPTGVPHPARTIVEDVVPLGEVELRPGEHVHATDGEIGRVQGFRVGPGGQVTHVLLKEGHLWGRKEVAIPAGAVTGVEDGIRLSLTRQQVEDLPPVAEAPR